MEILSKKVSETSQWVKAALPCPVPHKPGFRLSNPDPMVEGEN